MEKTSNVTVRLHEVITPIYADARQSSAAAFCDVMNAAMSPGGNNLQITTAKNYTRLLELLSETIDFVESFENVPESYGQNIRQVLNYLNNTPPNANCATFLQGMGIVNESFFETLKWAFRTEKTEATLKEI